MRSFGIGGDESPRRAPLSGKVSAASLNAQIKQAYRQIYFHAFKVDRDPALESRLRHGQISKREFVRGLLHSNKFRNDFHRCNSNYRKVDQIVGRVLGRSVHGQQERIALSILIAQRGIAGLADHLLDSAEYRDAFGDDSVPHQRTRVLPGRRTGDLPFNQQAPGWARHRLDAQRRRPWPAPPSVAGRCALAAGQSDLARACLGGGFGLTAFLLVIAAVMFSTRAAG